MPDQYVPGSQQVLPANAKSRLAAMRSDATHKGLFTSDLSVNEFLLVKEAGFDPLGLVVGSSASTTSAGRSPPSTRAWN